MKIFISYRRADNKPFVERIRDRLVTAYGENSIFRDIESIPPGANYVDVLNEATAECNVMLVMIGPQWVSMTDAQGRQRLTVPDDWTRIEVERGLANKDILVIPVLICDARMPGKNEIPETIGELAFRNAISIGNDPHFDGDVIRLMEGIDRIFGGASITVEYFEPKTILVPKGTFQMGSPKGSGPPANETPQHDVTLPNYFIGERPVKNSEYQEFVSQTGKLVPPIMGWEGQNHPHGQEDAPVVGVTLIDAIQYIEWLNKVTNRTYSLPNEAEWEKACRGSYGVQQPMGQILEWTCTLWGEKRTEPDAKYAYPWKSNDGRNELKISRPLRRVVRGYGGADETGSRRITARRGRAPDDPGSGDSRHGFRVIRIPS